jgi:hypothetical protein
MYVHDYDTCKIIESIPSVADNGLRPPSANTTANNAISYKAAVLTPVRSQASTPANDVAGNVSNTTKDKLAGRRVIGLRRVDPRIVEFYQSSR